MKHLKHLLPPVLLVLLICLLGFLNFKPATYFIGWDNFHSEFNPALNLKRAIHTTWQEYQSLGLLGGMAHGADLSRQLILYAAGLYHLPTNLFRYTTTFTVLAIGALGAYLLGYKTLFRALDSKTRKYASFFTALFYTLNWGTVQIFYAPFETFTSFFASLPWLLLTTLLYLQHQTSRRFLLLVITLLFTTSSFYIQTHFVVFLILLGIILLHHLIIDKHQSLSHKLKTWVMLALTLILTQSHWLFPVAIFSLTKSQTTIIATQNQVATRDVTARNIEYGNLSNVLRLKGFWYDYADLQENNQMGIMMDIWTTHTQTPAINLISFIFLLVTLLGILYSFKRHLPYRFLTASLFFVSLFFLVNRNPPSGQLYILLEQYIPIFSQFFRSVFTKWIVPASLAYSVLFGLGAVFIIDLFQFISHRHHYLIASLSLALMVLIYSSPSFQGYYTYPQMRQSLPSEYLSLFDYFKKQDPSTRIANFPQHTFWGWYQTNWGYRGSGFIWYGIEQPILDRAFDVWSKTSQDYYFEIRLAIYSQNLSLLESLLEKYSISWLLIDRSIVIPGLDNQKGLYLKELTEMLQKSQKVKKTQSFGFLDIYSVNLTAKPNQFIDSRPYSNSAIILEPSTHPVPATITHTASQLPSIDAKPKNCDNFNSTAFDRLYTGDEVIYTATNAMSCDHLVYNDLPHSHAYEFVITHQNTKGEPFLVCIEAHSSGQCEYFGYLPKSQGYQDTKLVVNRLKPGEKGFTVHLYTYSIGRIPTENKLKKITIKPISATLPQTQPSSNLPYAQIDKVTKHNYTYYEVGILPKDYPQLLTLNQAYDPGWKAYTFNSKSNLKEPLRYLFTILGLPLQEKYHLQNKGWENTWIIPADTSHVAIIYLPQLLQYFGFALLFLLIPLFVLHTKKASEEGR